MRIELPLPRVIATATEGLSLPPAPPVPDPRPEVISPGLTGFPAESRVNQGPRILVAEDNVTNQRVIRAMLEGSACQLEIVHNGRAALERYLETEAFDLLFFDIQMPEMDGPSALRAIHDHAARSGRPAPPAVALTANVMAHQLLEYKNAGFRAHLAKPIRRAALLALIDDMLALPDPSLAVPAPRPDQVPQALQGP